MTNAFKPWTYLCGGRERVRASYVAHVVSALYVLTTCLQRAYNVRSPCGCHVIVRRPYLHMLLTYGVLTHSHVVSVCTCDELGEFFRPMSWYICRMIFLCSPELPAAAASRCRPFHCRDYILHKSVRTTCVVSAEHVLTRYGPREFCVLIGQLN